VLIKLLIGLKVKMNRLINFSKTYYLTLIYQMMIMVVSIPLLLLKWQHRRLFLKFSILHKQFLKMLNHQSDSLLLHNHLLSSHHLNRHLLSKGIQNSLYKVKRMNLNKSPILNSLNHLLKQT
jgi:hypothetical protein